MDVDSKERLLQAMSELLWERGYAATSPREVRERSGVGQGSMYHHFPGKRELAVAAIERNCADVLPATQDLLEATGDPMAKLTTYLSGPLPALKGCKVGRLTQDPVVASDSELLQPVADAFDAVHRALARVIREAIALGQLDPDLDPEQVAYLLTATIQGGYVLAIAAQDPAPFDAARAGALALLRASAPTTVTAASAAGAAERN